MRDEQLSRGYFGVMSFLGLAAVALRNGQEDDEEPLIQVSGGGFNNPNQYTTRTFAVTNQYIPNQRYGAARQDKHRQDKARQDKTGHNNT